MDAKNNFIKVLLIVGILSLVLYIYLSIVPCKKVEKFELPKSIKEIIDVRTQMLQDQTADTNLISKDISNTIKQVIKLKDKVKMIMNESTDEETNNKTLMINTNGEISKMEE
jgi:hypothetical protein